MAASNTILNIAGHGKSVDLCFEKLEHDYDKQLIIVDKPITSGSGGVHLDADTILIDLGRLKQVVSITNGWVVDESASTAYSKITDLEYMVRRKGTVVITWKRDDGGSSKEVDLKVNIVKCKISEIKGRVHFHIFSTQTKSYMISIQFAVGSHKG